MGGLPDNAILPGDGFWRGWNATAELEKLEFSLKGSGTGLTLNATSSLSLGFKEADFGLNVTGRFDEKARLFDVDMTGNGSLDLSGISELSKIGLGSKVSLAISGDTVHATFSVLGREVEATLRRGAVEVDITQALEQAVPGITKSQATQAAIRAAAQGLFEPLLAKIDELENLSLIELRNLRNGLQHYLENLPQPPKCFPAGTSVSQFGGSEVPIERLTAEAIVLAFGEAGLGRLQLRPRRVKRVLRNTTTEWLRLTWNEDGQRKELVSTPGHHFLDRFGNFPTIEEMTRDGRATVVLASGALAEVKVERIVYSAETAHLFERAVAFVDTGDGTAAKPVELDCWQTYNIEVEDLHTYVAGGVRVHNDSGLLGQIGNAINSIDHELGVKEGGLFDIGTDFVSAIFHMAGEIADLPRNLLADILGLPDNLFENIGGGSGGVSSSSPDLRPITREMTEEERVDAMNWNSAHDGIDGTTHYQTEAEAAASEAEMNRGESNREKGNFPVLLDLDGDGIEITSLGDSTRFVVDAEGLQHRTAWAGNGDGVLFIETDTVAGISNSHEYVFTEWDASADDDMAALRSAFDLNGDGKLTSADVLPGADSLTFDWRDFRVLVTNADGSTTTRTLTDLGITEINLRADTTQIVLPDGSVIDGQATFVMGGVTRTAANVSLMAEAMGARVVDSTPTYDANLTRTISSTGYDTAGEKLFEVKSITTANGGTVTNFWDMNGDGVFERVQRIVTVVDGGAGARTETVEEWHGATIAGGVKDSRTVTVTSADGKQVTISRDHDWGGWYDERETQTTLGNGTRAVLIEELAQDGSVISTTKSSITADGSSRTFYENIDGVGSVNAGGAERIGMRTNVSRVRRGVSGRRKLARRSLGVDTNRAYAVDGTTW